MVSVVKDRSTGETAPRVDNALERFFALSLDLHVVASPDGFFKRVSDSVSDILGWSVEEFKGRPFIDFVHPDDHEATNLEVARQMTSGEKVLHFENRYQHKDGSWRVLAWKSIPFEGLMFATARDVTLLKENERELIEAKNAAEIAHRELETFSYSVAHDLRSPLRSIDGFSQALLEDCADQLSDAGNRFLCLIRESAQHMSALIDAILNLSRVTRSELVCEPVDLTSLGNTVLSRLRQSDPARRVDATVAGGLTTYGDRRLLTVVIENLIGNAWKYTSKRALARIEFGATTSDGEREYFVRDNGAGFDMAYAGKLFGVFERLHRADEFDGTGVGLATVLRIVQRHGGSLRAEGAIEEGATIYFTLPDGGQPK